MTDRRDASLTPEQLRLKSDSRALLRRFGGQDAAALRLGTRQQHLSDCVSPNVERFLTIAQVAVLEDETHGCAGHPIVTRGLAERQGFTLVRLPDAVPSGCDLLGLVAQQAKEGGEIASEICAALANDGAVDAGEAARVRAQVQDLIRVAVAMDAELALIEREG